MTAQAKWIAILCIAGLVIGLMANRQHLALLSLTILVWMICSYVIFRSRIWGMRRSLTITRTINGRDASTGVLWAGRTYDVTLDITCLKSTTNPIWQGRDLIPEILAVLPGTPPNALESDTRVTSRTSPNQSDQSNHFSQPTPTTTINDSWFSVASWTRKLPHVLAPKRAYDPWYSPEATPPNRFAIDRRTSNFRCQYRVKPRAAGTAVLPGVRFLILDSMNWFRIDLVIEKRQVIQLMPDFRNAGEIQPMLKHTNAIPQHGIHRQRRPGMGFELLELREYVDGDPPKSIAWKATARRDVLMTRQYESEIPMRIQLFIEGATSGRIGGYGLRIIDQMNTIAMSLTRMATRSGDWVGAYLVDNQHTEKVPTSTGDSGFYKIAKALSSFSVSSSPNRVRLTPDLHASAYALVSEYYPERLRRDVNPVSYDWFHNMLNQTGKERTQLASVIAHWYGLSEIEHTQLLIDDGPYAHFLQRLLCEHGKAWMTPIVPEAELSKLLSQHALDPLVHSIQRAALRAKDNEVFVIFVDLLSQPRNTNELFSAFKMAKARHHRVVVVCPTPNFKRPTTFSLLGDEPITAAEWRTRAEEIRLSKCAEYVKQQLREIAVPLGFSGEVNSIPLIMSEIELARSGRVASRGKA